MLTYAKKWVLITGASSGIGKEFARRFAELGANIILVSRREDILNELAAELISHHPVEVDVLPVDLSKLSAAEDIYKWVKQKNRTIHFLVNNAGFGVYGQLHQTDLHRNQEEVIVNVYTLASLTQLFLTDMVKQNEGNIINVASVAAFQPVSYMSNYAASKAYVLTFSASLWGEYHRSGIRVLAVCPGPVATEFFSVAKMSSDAIGAKETPRNVVMCALRALEKGKALVITGSTKNYLLAQLNRFVPRSLAAKITEKMMRPKV